MRKDRYLGIRNWIMMLRVFGVAVFLFLKMSNVVAQEYQLIQTIKTEARYFSTDKLQNIYLTSPQNEVVKYDKTGQAIFRYNNNRLGYLTLIDANNPFKIGLFYPELGNLIFLDRTMTQTGNFRLFDYNFIQIDAIALAADNNIWLYDKLNFVLKKINQRGELVFESGDLSLTLAKPLSPNFLVEREQQIYLNDPEVGILVFDWFGQYEKTLEFKGLHRFQILDGRLIFFQDGKLQAFNLQSLLMQDVKLPEGVGEDAEVLVQKNRLYVLENGQLEVFGF
ncbi:MAG: hypothetical protein ACI9XO_000872 [Paraglaciecola sp.]|jgi:hypothetical protein